jgi:hypothetical protein
MSNVGWRRNNHELDTRLPPVEDPVKLADFCQLSQTRLNATGHWSLLLTPVVKRAATIVISFAEIRGLYLAQRILSHAVLPFLFHFPIWVLGGCPNALGCETTVSGRRSAGPVPHSWALRAVGSARDEAMFATKTQVNSSVAGKQRKPLYS